MKHLGTQILATEHLTLRRFEPEDAEHCFYNWLSDPEVAKYLTWAPYQTVEQVQERMAIWENNYSKEDNYNWAIELNESEQPIGSISVVGINEDTESLEVGYCIGRKFWHRGIMTEALTEVVRLLMEEVGAGRVWAGCDSRNLYSAKTMAAAGMEYEGTLRRAGRNNQGICDEVICAKIRSEAAAEQAEEEAIEVAGAAVTKVMGEDGKLRNVISDETMEYVGILAKLELSPEEAEAAKKDMADMLDYIDKLNELDTTGIEPMSHVFPVHNVFREDVVTNGDGSEATLANAPVKKDGGFKVPKTIGD